MSIAKTEKSQFACIGQLLDFIVDSDGNIKYLRVVIAGRDCWLKLAKEARKTLDSGILPGCWLEMNGKQKTCKKTGQLKLKAETLRRIATPSDRETSVFVPPPATATLQTAKTKILVCQKSDCAKRGGKEICRALSGYLRDFGLDERVEVKMTGCLKQCKHGPNLVVMPDKTHYRKIAPQEIPALLDKHCQREPQPAVAL